MLTRLIEAAGKRFELIEAGSGDRLALCLHGFPEHAISWRHQIPVLAEMGYRVWALNGRGYGRSLRPERVSEYRLGLLLQDVADVIDVSGARSVVLIGHDWGAMLAWCFASLQLRPIERLVIMNVPHPLCFRAALRHWRQLRKSWYIGFFQIPGLPERLLSAQRGAAIRRMFAGLALPPEVMAIYASQIAERGAARAMLNWYRAMLLPQPHLDLTRVIEVPTFMIWGERDVALDPICLEGTERYVRELTITRLPGVSHWVQQDAPERVNALLRDFLAGNSGAPSPLLSTASH